LTGRGAASMFGSSVSDVERDQEPTGKVSTSSARRLDLSVIAAGGIASGAVALGAALLVQASVTTEGLGPTAATLSDAFSLLAGAAIGLAAGSACVAFAARRGPRILAGLIAGLLGYLLILAPTLIATAPSDVSVPDSLSTAALIAALVTPFILLGATVGAGIRSYRFDR
jgi:hypothetical protein